MKKDYESRIFLGIVHGLLTGPAVLAEADMATGQEEFDWEDMEKLNNDAKLKFMVVLKKDKNIQTRIRGLVQEIIERKLDQKK